MSYGTEQNHQASIPDSNLFFHSMSMYRAALSGTRRGGLAYSVTPTVDLSFDFPFPETASIQFQIVSHLLNLICTKFICLQRQNCNRPNPFWEPRPFFIPYNRGR